VFESGDLMCVACDWLQDCQHIAPAAEAPHIPDARDGLYLQSDAEIIANKERLAKVNYDKGDAVKLQGKALCMKVVGGDAYVGEACSTARRIDVAAGTAGRVYRDHAGPVSCVDVAVAGDGALLYTGSWDKTARVCDAATGAALMTLAGHGDFVKSIRVHGAHIYTGCTDKKLRQWDRATGKLIRTHAGHRHVPATPRRLNCLVVGRHSRSHSSCTPQARNRRHLRRPPRQRRHIHGIVRQHHWRLGHEGRQGVRQCGSPPLFSLPGGRTAIHNACHGLIAMATPQQTGTLAGHDTSVYCVRMGDGVLYSASADHTARQWDLAAGKARRMYQHPDWVRALEVREGFLFTGGRDGAVRAWDVDDAAQCMQTWEGHFDQVEALGLLDDGSRLVSAGLDGTLRSWDLAGLHG
jgi:WD40 repeat protein